VISHLHFDHAGGILKAWREGEPPALAFPNAHYVVGRAAWERACRPHPRDRASFIPELPALLVKTGRLEVLHGERSSTLGAGYRFHVSDGHSPGMLLAEIDTTRGSLVFVADLIPALPWIHLPITMGYDRHPELVIDEKRALLERVAKDDGWIFLTHDPVIPVARVGSDAGRFHARDPQRSLHWNGAG
jgi:glyoxylase-like metal-dependent hydrolase (beta-lactamase superfamily II)